MINLIPTNEKIRLSSLYQKRFFIVLLLFSATTLFIGTVFLIPPYFLAKEKTAAIKEEVRIARSLSASREVGNPEFVMKDIQKKMDLFASKKSQSTPSLFIEDVLNDLPLGVSITGFTYTKKSNNSDDIEIRGVAQNRETFLSFVRALESEEDFAKVNVPISSFLSDKNLNFSLLVSTKIK